MVLSGSSLNTTLIESPCPHEKTHIMSPSPTTIQELITLLNRIALEHGTDTPVEFQDCGEDDVNVEIVLKNNVDYTNPSNSYKKLCIQFD